MLRLGGREVGVIGTPVGGLALVEATAAAREVEVEVGFDFREVKVRPLRWGVRPEVAGRRVSFALPGGAEGAYLSVEFDGNLRRPLVILADPPEVEHVPAGALTFEPGRVHDIGVLALESGQTVHIPAGAVVRGAFETTGVEDVTIRGRGVLDLSGFQREVWPKQRSVVFNGSKRIRVEGITVFDGASWNVVCVGCDDVAYERVKVFAWTNSDDAFDIVGSRDVTMRNCFARCKDDCVAVKASTFKTAMGGGDVERVLVEGCTFWNAEWGNALEIGYETQCDRMRGITFRDIDVIHSEPERWTSGGVLTIHNGDRAHISDVLYEDIRVEDAGHKLIDFKITLDQYSKDATRGQIDGVTIRDVRIVDGAFAPSIIQGFGFENVIRNVTIENLVVQGAKVESVMDARLITERSQNVKVV